MSWLERTELLFGKEKLEKLKQANVLVVGLGGVGAYAAEQLCRAGIGKMTIVDGDVVEESNRNRQLPALVSTKGMPKAEILAQRFKDINPEIELTIVNDFIQDERTLELLKSQPFDYVVDAIDTLSPKVFLVFHALQMGLKVVSSMGAGGKTDPSKIELADISKSYNCKLAKMMRKRLSRLGVKKGLKVVFSSQEIDKNVVRKEDGRNKKSTVGTVSYMPPLFGCFIASAVIRDLVHS
ncbi:tRNA threonylcarbamoyladenosine dehydratase [Maribellus sp. YY47]|uniref:tRNA threonylcarbamoyladenosine dehydratase n=1 Tax=Maribellus sp. YY47 TaxID=2929486 RepID=UPI002000FDB7|nr:tRNA threonylcarbamoyladenosine dehydratase [Maribellus sp. YY47]MCK3684861.1 tRNA threonylcarbamoyladenosine dehydratase [Maribellus sp. YY47]